MRWYFDFISPFSYLQWQKVKRLDAAEVTPVPIAFGAVLAANGQKGPAEIPGKREFTYRHVLWQARAEDVMRVAASSYAPLNVSLKWRFREVAYATDDAGRLIAFFTDRPGALLALLSLPRGPVRQHYGGWDRMIV